jgi:Family of unknown function (DUF5343)
MYVLESYSLFPQAPRRRHPALGEKSHPYISASGSIAAAISQFRKAFPATVNAETLKKLSIASNNESYLINILRFIGAIDEEGNRTDKAQSVFSKHDDAEFQKAFESLVKSAYKELFELQGDVAWQLDDDKLIGFFRATDKSSAIVGRRQANTFQTLASLAGHGEVVAPKTSKPKAPKNDSKPAVIKPAGSAAQPTSLGAMSPGGKVQSADVGLTVRIEVNLPAAAEQDTYDKIFRSIRENLLNAK